MAFRARDASKSLFGLVSKSMVCAKSRFCFQSFYSRLEFAVQMFSTRSLFAQQCGVNLERSILSFLNKSASGRHSVSCCIREWSA